MRTLPLRLIAEAEGAARELGPEGAVRDPMDGVVPTHERDEDLGLGPGHGVKAVTARSAAGRFRVVMASGPQTHRTPVPRITHKPPLGCGRQATAGKQVGSAGCGLVLAAAAFGVHAERSVRFTLGHTASDEAYEEMRAAGAIAEDGA